METETKNAVCLHAALPSADWDVFFLNNLIGNFISKGSGISQEMFDFGERDIC